MTQLNNGHFEKNGIFPTISIYILGASEKIMPKTFVDNLWKCHGFVQQITLGSLCHIMFQFLFCLYNDEPIFFLENGAQVLRDFVNALKTRRSHPITMSCQLKNNNVNSATT